MDCWYCVIQNGSRGSWAGYNLLLSESKPLIQVGALALVPELAHEWSTLLTVIMQDHPTVISLDMALY